MRYAGNVNFKKEYSFYAILLLVAFILSGTVAGIIAGVQFGLPWIGFATLSVCSLVGSKLVGEE